jgi:hypothetical protein
MAKPNSTKREIRYCLHCGRDTRSKGAVCWRCYTGYTAGERRGRRALPPGVYNDSPMDPYHEDDLGDERSSREEYQGDTYRDDL